LLSGVVGWIGPDGANEKRGAGFFVSDAGGVGAAADGEPNEKGLEGGAAGMGCGFSARTSCTIWLTSADGFAFGGSGALTGAVGVAVAAGLPKLAKGWEGVLDEPAGSVGMKPPLAGGWEDVAAGSFQEIVAGGTGIFAGAGAGSENSIPRVTGAFNARGRHSALFAAAPRCFSYCLARLGRICLRSRKGSSRMDVARNEEIAVLSPRKAV